MEHNIDISGNIATIALKGRFTFADHQMILDILANFQDPVIHCTMDISNLEFIDSAGLGMIILAKDTITEKNGQFVLRCPQGQVKKVLDLTKFADILTIKA
ncbi:MAG: STAS domain-containing protein [Magnetovibrio sp.]|nr:STAS domain-containing protein [Magnetovibrio sp.]